MTRRSSAWPARVKWINGEALTTGGSSKPDFPLQLFHVDVKHVDLSRRELAEEIGPRQARERSGSPRGEKATPVPVDHSRESHLALELDRRLAQGGEYV